MFNAGSYWITIAEMASFEKEARDIFNDDEYNDLVLHLATHPDAGDIIPDTGGVRKIRWPARGQGKRSGARVIYYFRDLNVPVYLLAVYAKGEKINLTMAEKKQMRKSVDLISSAAVGRRMKVVIA